MLYGPDGNPLPEDTREGWQKEFDRKLRAQMADNGGQYFPREFVSELKHQFEVRRKIRLQFMAERERTPKMDAIAERFDEKAKTPKNRVWSIPK